VPDEKRDPWRMLWTDANEFHLRAEYEEQARQAGIEIAPLNGHEADDIAAQGGHCHGLFLFRARIDDVVLAAMPHCKLLARVGTGYDLIDVAAARRRGIMVTYVPDFSTDELSDQVMAFILGFSRMFPFLFSRAPEHHWFTFAELPVAHRVRGQQLGILGFGRSGQRLAEKARAFGMEVLVWTRTPRPNELASTGARTATFEEVLGCDYVSLHLPLTEATRGLIGRDAFAHFKPEAVLLNVSRGLIVDTDALVDALREGRLGGAGLDVVHPSPLPPEHPLWSLPNVWITSHTGAHSEEGSHEALSTVIGDAIRVHAGQAPLFPVPELRDAALPNTSRLAKEMRHRV
jgi:D-3-phosphoglycerate dehydrogenase / 2-oxoglutarate reductase